MKAWFTHIRVIALFWGLAGGLAGALLAEDRVIVVSPATELTANFDLAAVAEVFKESESLQDFERALNDPDVFLNNLDLNGDGEVDFIRVLEEENESGRLIVLQAIVGDNSYVDVAYIDIAQEEDGKYEMQIRGETSLYGDNYYYVPDTYNISSWPMIVTLYDPFYDYYSSPYYWNHYPDWWASYSCIRVGLYRAQVVFRFPYHTFKRSYRPWVKDYYRFHNSFHHDYTPVIHPRRYTWDYRDRDRRNHDYYNDRKRQDWDHNSDRWKNRDRNDNRSEHRDWNRDRNSRDNNRRNLTDDRPNRYQPPKKDKSEYSRPVLDRSRNSDQDRSRDNHRVSPPRSDSGRNSSGGESRGSPKSPSVSPPVSHTTSLTPLPKISKPTPLPKKETPVIKAPKPILRPVQVTPSQRTESQTKQTPPQRQEQHRSNRPEPRKR